MSTHWSSRAPSRAVHISAKVFVGGSRRLSRLSPEVKRRLDGLMENGLAVMVGDANGADKAVQQYLASKRYSKVTVFCMAGKCRNNLGDWPTREMAGAPGGRRDAAYYGVKDRAMGREADYGFMLWDRKSRGTLANIEDLIRRQKPVVAYLAEDRSFVTLRDLGQLAQLMARSNSRTVHRPARATRARTSHSSRNAELF
jgi:hypothetical protein